MFALVINADTFEFDGVPDFCVLLFETEDEATQAAEEMVAQTGDIKPLLPNGWAVEGHESPFASRSDAFDFWQESLGVTELCHVYPVATRN